MYICNHVQFLTDNTEFTVVGVIGPPGVGKSTVLNEIYGFDSSSPGKYSVYNRPRFKLCR